MGRWGLRGAAGDRWGPLGPLGAGRGGARPERGGGGGGGSSGSSSGGSDGSSSSSMREARFRDNFWSTDLTSTVGYDNIVQHLNDGRKNCKEFEDFLKERAIIEEKYGKELINLSKKKPCGQTELNTLKRSLDVFKQQVDNVGQSHIQLAQTLREEAKKMEDFREKQKLHRKKIELIMEAIHKNRNLQYKKTMEAKRLYEQRCRDKDEAEQAVHRNANLVTQKQQEKLFLKLAQTKSALEDSDRGYQQNIAALEKIREEWQKEHIKACEFFETQECERINYFRNALWLHANQLSQDCVQNDEGYAKWAGALGIVRKKQVELDVLKEHTAMNPLKYEDIRKSLEMCSIEKDIEFFVNLRKTGSLAPAPVVYENYYNTQRNATPARSQASVPISRRAPLPTPTSGPDDPDYVTVDGYSLIHH
uniref:Proline-serine-threonine phosphatase-interacting protein 2 n=1 Tax=Apteryx owenii TaxID=8824 RepID=A0A8B9NXZ6_APTOW